MTNHYRPELDGIRAIAVLSVMTYHAGMPYVSGGYLGVDVFFVLSGYLIASLLLDDLRNNRFSFLDFYERRARRILPALILVVMVCWPFAWSWMTPKEFQRFSASVLSVSLFYSNHYFLSHDYFSPLTGEMPLLHTWSLAVEEQFYLFFPPLLLLLWKWSKRAVAVVMMLLAFASYLVAVWLLADNPGAAFYLTIARAWQLSAGVGCALLVSFWRKPAPSTTIASLGLAAIFAAVLGWRAEFFEPESHALLAVIGTCAIIVFSDRNEWVGRVLSLPPLVGIGLISYSAYLWHQPLFAFTRLREIEPPTPMAMGAMVLLSLVLAAITWKFVEQPFRQRGVAATVGSKKFAFSAASASAAFVAASIYVHTNGGLPWRIAPNGLPFAQMDLDNKTEANMGLGDICEQQFTLDPACRTSQNPELVVWGDSYAMHLVDGFLASSDKPSLAQHTKSKCAPIMGLSIFDSETTMSWAKQCVEFNQRVFEWISQTSSIKVVVLASPFWGLLRNRLYVEGRGVEPANQREILVSHLLSTANVLRQAGKRVVVIAPPPNNGKDIGRCLSKSALFGLDGQRCDFEKESISDIYKETESFLGQMESAGLPVIWLSESICKAGTCSSSIDGQFIFRDSGHLSKEGSALVGRQLAIYKLANQMAR